MISRMGQEGGKGQNVNRGPSAPNEVVGANDGVTPSAEDQVSENLRKLMVSGIYRTVPDICKQINLASNERTKGGSDSVLLETSGSAYFSDPAKDNKIKLSVICHRLLLAAYISTIEDVEENIDKLSFSSLKEMVLNCDPNVAKSLKEELFNFQELHVCVQKISNIISEMDYIKSDSDRCTQLAPMLKKFPECVRASYQKKYQLLQTAVFCKYIETVKLLLSYGADPNYQGEMWRKSSLHLAVESNCPEIVKLLLDASGINFDLRDHFGKTAYEKALSKANEISDDKEVLKNRQEIINLFSRTT
jgi:hypothetical protein